MLIFNGLWQFRAKSARVTAAALCTYQFGKPIWKDGSKIEMGSSGLGVTWTTSASAHWQWWRRKTKGQREGGREKNRRGNEYLTVTHGVKERNVFLADLLVFFIPRLCPLPLSLPPSTPHLCSMPIEICKHNSLGNRIKRFMKKSVFGLGLLWSGKYYLRSAKQIHALKVNWNYHTATA